MSIEEIVATLREFRYRRGPYAGDRARLQLVAKINRILPADSIARRIFHATDVERTPYKLVASQMGMLLRHFFRLRNEMVAQIARDWQSLPIEVSAETNGDLLRLECARRALQTGHAAAAKETAEQLIRGPLRMTEAVEVLLLHARADYDAGAYDAANARLDEAKRALHGVDPADRDALNRDLIMTRAYCLYHDGAYSAAFELSRSALPLEAVVPAGTPYDVRKTARHALFIGVQCEEIGLPHECLAYLRAARSALLSLEHPPAGEIAAVQLQMVSARVALPSEALAAEEDADEALRLAEWHGLRPELAQAHLFKGMALYASGFAQQSVEWANRAIAIARDTLSVDPLARTLFIASRFESAAGLGAQAVRHVLEARPHVRNNGLLSAIFPGAIARARRAAGEVAGVIEAATESIRLMEGRSDSPYIGLAYFQRAAARHTRGDKNIEEDVDAALNYLRRGAPLNDQLNALELSFLVTGNRRHRSEAAEIKHVLTAAS